MSSFYLYRDSKMREWQRCAEYDECGYFVGQYFLNMNGIEDWGICDYWLCTDRSVQESWQAVFKSSHSIMLPLMDEEMVRLILTNFVTVNEDYPHE